MTEQQTNDIGREATEDRSVYDVLLQLREAAYAIYETDCRGGAFGRRQIALWSAIESADAILSQAPPARHWAGVKGQGEPEWTDPANPLPGVRLLSSVEFADKQYVGAMVEIDGKPDRYWRGTGGFAKDEEENPEDYPAERRVINPNHKLSDLIPFVAKVRAERKAAKSKPVPYTADTFPIGQDVRLRCARHGILSCRVDKVDEHGIYPSLASWLQNWQKLADEWEMSNDGGQTWKPCLADALEYKADPVDVAAPAVKESLPVAEGEKAVSEDVWKRFADALRERAKGVENTSMKASWQQQGNVAGILQGQATTLELVASVVESLSKQPCTRPAEKGVGNGK
ncbi:MAG: hypothetical protein QM754_18370 [Tepidisphaeraceae bacterium]